ncbi:hypothetical protein WUBG_08794, partial [Wuchereria bancrofti]
MLTVKHCERNDEVINHSKKREFGSVPSETFPIPMRQDSGMEDAEACRDAETEIKNCSSIGEAIIILNHLFGFCLEQGFIAAKAISDKKEAESLIQELQNESILSDVILNHALEDAKRNTEQQNRSRDASPYRECEEDRSQANGNQIAQDSRDELREVSPPASAHKIRRRTATPSELLYPLKESLQGQVTKKTHLEQLNEETPSVGQQLVEKAQSVEHCFEGGRALELNSVSNVGMEAKNEVTKLIDLELDDRGSTESSPSSRGSRRRSGRVLPYVPRTLTGTRDKVTGSRLLVRTHTLDGHTRTVLSVDTNGDV